MCFHEFICIYSQCSCMGMCRNKYQLVLRAPRWIDSTLHQAFCHASTREKGSIMFNHPEPKLFNQYFWERTNGIMQMNGSKLWFSPDIRDSNPRKIGPTLRAKFKHPTYGTHLHSITVGSFSFLTSASQLHRFKPLQALAAHLQGAAAWWTVGEWRYPEMLLNNQKVKLPSGWWENQFQKDRKICNAKQISANWI